MEWKGKELKAGIWRSPYIRVFSVGNGQRVYEVSNFQRVHRDDSPHVYTEDVAFKVVEADLNYTSKDGSRWYESQAGAEGYYREGETAAHYKGEPLPGAFPLWVEVLDGKVDASEVDLAERKVRAIDDTDATMDGVIVKFGPAPEIRHVLGRK